MERLDDPLRTPYWLGFAIQRPESHLVHHQLGLHAFNYGDLPLWDMLFGTFRNPRQWNERCGFDGDAELRVGELLAGRDVNAASSGGRSARRQRHVAAEAAGAPPS